MKLYPVLTLATALCLAGCSQPTKVATPPSTGGAPITASTPAVLYST